MSNDSSHHTTSCVGPYNPPMKPADTQPHFFDLSLDELSEMLQQWGMPRYAGKQVMQWVYEKGVADPARMTNLSHANRQRLAEQLRTVSSTVVQHQMATDGVQKLLVDWADPTESGSLPILGSSDTQTECVMIPTENRKTACISSQIGCPVGCKFCASGIGGLDGNLTAGQIVEQVWRLQQLPDVGRISNIVFMGMGEPLSNLEQVTRAVSILVADWGLNLSGRKITISTVGLPAQIRRLADEAPPVTLAISLHAPNDTIRRELIPWADYVSISQLLEAGQYYFRKTGREVTLEYILLGRVNDQIEHAQELARIARTLRGNVNLIRYNEVDGLPYRRPQSDDVHRFQDVLRKSGINAHIRASRGRDIAAACGQLRHESARTA